MNQGCISGIKKTWFVAQDGPHTTTGTTGEICERRKCYDGNNGLMEREMMEWSGQ